MTHIVLISDRVFDEILFFLLMPFVWTLALATSPVWIAVALAKYRPIWLADRVAKRQSK